MGGGGKGGGGSSEVRFAPYIEDKHSSFLNIVANKRAAVVDDSPYDGYADIEIEDAFFGSGYVLASFPALYDMFGKFMAGLDIDVLFEQLFLDSTTGTVINNLVGQQAIRLSEDLEQVAEPRLVVGMRDINSVISSSFVVARAMLETQRVKELSKFDAELRYRMIPVAVDRWKTHLQWNKDVVDTYAQVMKFYFITKIDTDNQNYEMAVKNKLWPFTVLRYEGEALGALQGAKDIKDAATSTPQRMLGGAMTGAAAGYMVSGGNPTGAVIGGALGLASGLF